MLLRYYTLYIYRYAGVRFAEYKRRKDLFLNLHLNFNLHWNLSRMVHIIICQKLHYCIIEGWPTLALTPSIMCQSSVKNYYPVWYNLHKYHHYFDVVCQSWDNMIIDVVCQSWDMIIDFLLLNSVYLAHP